MQKVATTSTNIRIIHASDFIRATPEGMLNLELSKKLLIELASATTSLVDYEIILDTRKTVVGMSVLDLWYLASELSNFSKVFSRKTAVLCPVESFDRAEFFALCAQNRGFPVRAFNNYEDAIDWLTASGK